MNLQSLHKVQLSILRSLHYTEAARFNELRRLTTLESDAFKFHIRSLVRTGYIQKRTDGRYELTTKGKELSNNLNESERAIEKQPKLSVLIVASRETSDGTRKFLLQKRARHPYKDFWNEITGRVRWGESLEDAARRDLLRQTGLEADFTVHSIRRIRDYQAESQDLLEDKLFVVVEAINIKGELRNEYAGGLNKWLTFEDLLAEEKYFASTPEIIKSLKYKKVYIAQDLTYQAEEY